MLSKEVESTVCSKTVCISLDAMYSHDWPFVWGIRYSPMSFLSQRLVICPYMLSPASRTYIPYLPWLHTGQELLSSLWPQMAWHKLVLDPQYTHWALRLFHVYKFVWLSNILLPIILSIMAWWHHESLRHLMYKRILTGLLFDHYFVLHEYDAIWAILLYENCYLINVSVTNALKRNSTMTSSNGNIFRVTRPFWREPTDAGGLKKASDAELWCFLWYAPQQTIQQTMETSVIWDAIALIMTSVLFAECGVMVYDFQKCCAGTMKIKVGYNISLGNFMALKSQTKTVIFWNTTRYRPDTLYL